MEMTTLELSYGRGTLKAQVPATVLQAVLQPQPVVATATEAPNEAAILRAALKAPIDTPRLRHIARPGQRATVVTSDLTRPCPSHKLLPPVLEELSAAGVPDEDIDVVLALGLHRPMTAREMETAVGPEVYHRLRVLNHDPKDTIHLGETQAGTPVEIFRAVVEADLRICLGNLELHYFAGYSGGAKAILPGCASRAAVTNNHAMMVRPEAAAGRLAGNPVRADLEEGVALLGADFILNVVVDAQHRIVEAVAGDVISAHRRGCELVARRAMVPIDQPADLVLVSAGGFPKDVNLYQAQKALDNAAYAVRDGGILILVAECTEGLGNQTFESWMTRASSPDEILDRIQQEFVLGGHKAAAVASVLKRATVFMVSALPAGLVQRCGLIPFASLDTALAGALGSLGPEASVLVLPQGGSILPVVRPA
jgi:nickel-dependent lactate racemase